MDNPVRRSVLIALTVALTAASAQLRLPMWPVPLTLQSLVVLLAGAALGPGTGAAAMGIYLALGLAGLPLFASGGGVAYLFTPSFGYLAAFPAAAAVCGLLLPARLSRPGTVRRLLALLAGTATVYLVGLAYLAWNMAWVQDRPLPLRALLTVGLLPFLPGDLVKLLLGSWLIPRLRRALERR